MARLVSCVGVVLLLLLKAHHRHRQQCVVFLGMTFLVTLIAADSPAAGDSRLHSAHRHADFLGDFPSSTGSPPPPAASRNTAFQSPDSPVAPFIPNPAHEARTADGMPFRWQRIPPSPSEPFDPSHFLAEEPRPLSPSEPASRSSLQSEAAAQLPADRKRSAALSPTRTRTQQLPRSNVSSTPLFGPSSSQTRGNATSQPAPLPQPSDLDSPDWVPLYVLPNSDEVLVPGYNVPFIAPHPTSPSSEPTEVPPEDFYPTNTMEPDWGSGDYLETMSFLNSDGDDYSLVTKVPSDSYDLEDYTESYDTSFPSRVGISPSSSYPLHFATSPSFTTAYGGSIPLQSTVHGPNTDIPDISDIDWPDAFTIQPTDVLLPDMNSLEYYTIQLTKENGSGVGAEHKGKVTIMSVATPTETTPTGGAGSQSNQTEEESSSDLSGFDESAAAATTEANPQLVTVSEPVLDPSIVPSHFFDASSSAWGGQVSTTMWSTPTPSLTLDSVALTEAISPHLTPLLPDDATSTSSSLTDVHWFVTESFLSSTADTAPVLTTTAVFSAIPTQPVPDATAGPTESTPQDSPSTTEQTLNTTLVSTDPTPNVTTGPPAVLSDQGVTDDGEGDARATVTSVPVSSEATVATSPLTTATTTTTTSQQPTTTTTTTEATTGANAVPTTSVKTTTAATTARQYLCSVDRPVYLVKIAFPSGATVGYAKSQIRDILKAEFNKSVELQVVDGPPKFVFRAVSGPVVYTAISVINALRRSGRRFLSVSPSWTVPDSRYQVHTVLQFVPGHVDVRYCNFSESIERGLTMAFAEVRRRSKQSTNFTVQIVNITMAAPKHQEQRLARQPVDITFTTRASLGYLTGSEVSDALMKLTTVEFSYYMGFPVLQIAEPFLYPELNTSQLLRSSWVRTVLLGVLDQKVGERTFQANMERRVAMLLGEAMALGRRVKRATAAGNNSVQIVSANRLVGADHPLEIIYFVEGPSGQRIPGVQTANLLNSLDVQRAAIVLGYRVQGILAQPVEKVMSSPSDSESTNMWIIIGVVIPLLVVIIIISILYWKLCRTDKLEFQPDAMTSIQQRQKSATSFRESRTSLHRTVPPTKRDRQFREEEEYEEEEEAEYEEEEEGEEEEEEEEKEVKMKPLAPLRSVRKMSSEEEEEEEEGEEEEEEEEEEGEDDEEEEEEEEEDKGGEKRKVKSEGAKSEEQRRGAGARKTGEMTREEKKKGGVKSKGRRGEQELQAPSVKGFDFAKLHLGQQSKDDIMVIQESVPSGPGPLPMSVKDGLSPSENGEIPTPISKTSASSTKASRTSRRRERISPSDVDSVVSDRSSEQESTEENLRAHATPSDSKQTRPPPVNGTSEQLSSAAIFEHVDRMSRAADTSRRLPNKVQLIAMQPMPMPPLHRPPVNGKVSDTNQINKEIQVALRHKSEIEHHRNKIRLRAKRKGHYDFPAMDDVTGGLGDPKDQDRIYQKAQTQIDKILDPDTQMSSIFMESKKSGRGRRSPKQRMKEQLNGGMMEADKDHLITEDNDAAYRKCPGVNNVAYVSDPDQGPGSPHRSPSPTDDVFLGPTSSPPGHAPPPPPYMPPQPSIEEARQQMHSLLDDAFALVSPTSQGSTAGITLPGVNSNHSSSSPPGQGPRSWGPSYQGFSPFPNRFTELSMTSPSVQALTPRQGIGSSYLPPGETGGHGDQLQADSLFSSRGLYDELPSSARPRPVGGTTGAQLHHLTQVGLSSRLNSYPAGVRAPPGQNGGIGWNQYHDDFSRVEPEKDVFPDCPDYSSNSVFQMPRSVMREPSAPPAHLETPVVGYLSAPPPLDTSPPTHSSASLIKAIREELLRLSQKQAAMPSYHS